MLKNGAGLAMQGVPKWDVPLLLLWGFYEEEREDDVAYAAWDPDRKEKKNKNAYVRKQGQGRSNSHDDVKKGRPGAHQNMSRVREFCRRKPVRYRNTYNSQRVNKPPFFNEANVNMPVRHFKKRFSEIGNHGIAERGDAY
jgi:hypothetical protein